MIDPFVALTIAVVSIVGFQIVIIYYLERKDKRLDELERTCKK